KTKPPRSRRERRRFHNSGSKLSAVTQTVGSALPLCNVVGDQAGRLHCRLAELRITCNLALDPLTFGVESITKSFQLADHRLDFRQRGAGNALDERVEAYG